MRIGATGLAGLLTLACASEAAPTVEVVRAERSPDRDRAVEGPPSVEVGGIAVAALHRQALADADRARGAQTLEQACERGLAPSCVAFADRLESGDGVEADPDRARGVLEQTCLDGSTLACDRLGH